MFVEINRQTSDSYSVIFMQPKIEFCRIYAGLEYSPLVNLIKNAAKSFKNGLLESCSRAGAISSYNISSADVPVERWPSGNYKTEIKLFDDFDDNIFNLTTETTVFN